MYINLSFVRSVVTMSRQRCLYTSTSQENDFNSFRAGESTWPRHLNWEGGLYHYGEMLREFFCLCLHSKSGFVALLRDRREIGMDGLAYGMGSCGHSFC